MSGTIRTLLHVGFCHSGTTSLQQNFFASRRDIFYCGSTGDHGGILSLIKYEEDWPSVERKVRVLCDTHIWCAIGPTQRLVVSDETLVEQPEVYYTPQKMPVGLIAQRLKRLFPRAVILFTLRNQFDYVVSCYLNLKRNYAYLADRCIEDFDAWFAGNHSQIANQYLRNLDYSRPISAFVEAFGRKAVAVLPLEARGQLGDEAYLGRIGDLLGIEISEADADNFRPIRNRRVSSIEDAMLTRWHDPVVRRLHHSLGAPPGTEHARPWVNGGEPARVPLNQSQIATIYRRCADGNRYLQSQFGVDLAALGYPMEPAGSVGTRVRSAFARLKAGARGR